MPKAKDGFFEPPAGVVAGTIAGALGRFVVAVDRAALRQAVRRTRRAGDHLAEAAGNAGSGLDGAAHRHPGFASSPALIRFADSWRERRRQVADDLEGFAGLLARICDGYQYAEDAAEAILRRFLDPVAGGRAEEGGPGTWTRTP